LTPQGPDIYMPPSAPVNRLAAMPAPERFPIILPSETQTREFDAKLLLAGMLAERGHPVHVGSRIEIHNRINELPRGLYLAKDIRRSSRRIFRIMDRLGFSIAAWDEEALIFPDPATYHDRRVDPETLGHARAFLAWGERNRALIESAPGYLGTPVHVTGNPRFDLLVRRCRGFFEPEVAALRDRFGEFILINSNFGRINYFVSRDAVRENADGRLVNLGAGTEPFWRFRMEVFESFKSALPAIARAFPDRQVVLRPHPAEAHEAWRAAAEGLPNVSIVHEGNVYPWILASAVTIHNGCTTGLEGYLLGHPVLAYQPVTSEEFDRQLPNLVSTPVHSQEELIATLGALFSGTPPAPPGPEARALAEESVGPLDGTLASERIDALIAAEGEGWMSGRRPSLGTRARGHIGSLRRRLSKTVNSFRRGHKNSRAYNRHRFPGLDEAEVRARLARLGEVTGRFGGLGVRRVSGNIFVVAPR
jgi:surface carbohydrate biosynthesis protein